MHYMARRKGCSVSIKLADQFSLHAGISLTHSNILNPITWALLREVFPGWWSKEKSRKCVVLEKFQASPLYQKPQLVVMGGVGNIEAVQISFLHTQTCKQANKHKQPCMHMCTHTSTCQHWVTESWSKVSPTFSAKTTWARHASIYIPITPEQGRLSQEITSSRPA